MNYAEAEFRVHRQVLSPDLCGYRKGYSTQTALISMLEKWKLSIGNKDFAASPLIALSKAFDTINH